MMKPIPALAALALVAAAAGIAAAQTPAAATNDGAQLFAANCAACHQPPIWLRCSPAR